MTQTTTADPRWRRRSNWIVLLAFGSLVACLAIAAVWRASQPAGLAILISGIALLVYAVIVLRDVGGVGTEDGERWIGYYKKYLARLPFSRGRSLPPGFANTYRRWCGVMAVLIGASYAFFGALLLSGIARN